MEINRAEPLPGLRAWITAHCHLAHGRKSVCCEQIAFYLTGKVTGRFRNTVFAHLNSDLPLVFWWQGELSDILTERLVSVMDRLIIDSSTWADPAASFRRIEEASMSNTDLILHDHEWTRTWQFRLGVAGIFDDPAAQQALPEIDTVEITHHPAHRNCALQLLAWLAVQAGWKDRGSTAASPLTPLRQPPFHHAQAKTRRHHRFPRSSCAPATVRAHHPSRRSQPCRTPHRSTRLPVTSLSPADPSSPEELVALQLARGGKNSLFQKILPRFRKFLDADTGRRI